MTEHLPILVVILPVMGSLVVFLLWRTGFRYEWHISTAVTFLSFLLSLFLLKAVWQEGPVRHWLGGWAPPWGIEVVVDSFSAFVLAVVTLVGFVTSVYSAKSVKKEAGEGREATFYALYLLLSGGLSGIVVTGDLFNLYVFLEISSLSAYALVGVGKKKRAIVASYNYLILGTIGATFYLLGVGHLYAMTGTLNMADLSQRLPALYESRVIIVSFALILVGLSIKMALFPFHAWLPDAHGLAPSVVSPILSACVIEVAAYALIRVVFNVYSPRFAFKVLPAGEVFLLLAVAAMLAGSYLTLAQTDIKRMLAYSSVGQMGYVLLGVALANHAGLTGSVVHLFSHALIKSGLFLTAGSLIYQTGISEIVRMKGMGRRMPLTMATFTIGALGMIGLPLTTGFLSEWKLALGALEAGKGFLVPVILLSALLNAVYFGRVIETVWFKTDEPHGPEERTGSDEGANEAPLSLALPPFVLVSLSVVFGVGALLPVSLAEKAASLLVGGPP